MKKTLLKLKTITSVITAFFICIMIADAAVLKADGGPDLMIETREIDINDIPEDRYITLDVSIDNNPGIFSLKYSILFDPRLDSDLNFLFPETTVHASNWEGSIYDEHAKKAYLGILFDESVLYDGNDTFMKLGFFLPESCSPGDFYQISFINGEGFNTCGYIRPYEPHSGLESFGTMTTGGIKITGNAAHEEPQQPAPEPEHDPEPEPIHQPEPEPEKTAPAETEKKPETAASVSSVSETTSANTAASPVTSLTSPDADITTVPETSEEKKETVSSGPVITNTTENSNTDHKDNDKGFLIPVILAAAALVSVFSIIIIKRSKANEQQ